MGAIPHREPALSKYALLAPALFAAIALSCTGDGTPVPTPSPEATATAGSPGAGGSPAISLTPRPGIPADLPRARSLEAEGNIEAAVNIYIAAAAAPASRSEGTLAAARLLLELDRPAEARTLLEPFAGTASGQDLAARYMLARAYTALGLHAEALQQYDLYIQSGRAALPYAYLDRARNLLELGRPLDAAASARTGLDLGVPPSARGPFRTVIAQSLERAGSLTEAITAYEALIDSDGAFALARIAAIKRELGDPTAANDLIRLLGGYPGSATALDEMTKAVARGETIPPVLSGIVNYRHNEYTKAEPFFRQQIATAPDDPATAEAYYYLGAVQESRGEIDAALANYERATATNPASLIADDAIWWRGRIAQDDERYDDAGELYARLVREYPASSWANDAAFRRGMLDYVNEDFTEAASAWGAAAATTADPLQEQRLSFWQAKALLEDGDDALAELILEDMADTNEDDFYGIRALTLLEQDAGQPEHGLESKIDLNPSFNWPEAEAWLSQKTGRAISESAWSADQRWQRAQELWLVGRVSQGDGEVFNLMESNAADPVAMYTLSRKLLGLGRISMSGRAGQRLLRTLDSNPNEGLPKPILSLAYPPAFGSFVSDYAAGERISPLLLLAFVRQESFFDPRAESPVGALGLTQVLPDTAGAAAAALRISNFEVSQLQHADINLRLGAYYMAKQLAEFDNEIFVALAAYNAGPRAAARWRDADGAADADLYLETVEFAETRLYIEIVAENYAIYRYLYGGESKPTLP